MKIATIKERKAVFARAFAWPAGTLPKVLRSIAGSLVVTTAVGASAQVPRAPTLAAPPPVNPSNYHIAKPADKATGEGLWVWGESFWLDNERVVLSAADRLAAAQIKDGSLRYNLYIWNTRSGHLSKHSDQEIISLVCVADGFVRYTVKRNGTSAIREGRLGEERERPRTSPKSGVQGQSLYAIVNPYTCQEYWYEQIVRPNGGGAYPLRDEHGVLEQLGAYGTQTLDVTAHFPPFRRWLHTPDGKSLDLELPQKPLRPQRPKYSRLLRKYLFEWSSGQIEPGMAHWLYLVNPSDGKISTLEIPGSAHWKNLSRAVLTRAGVLASSSYINVRRDRDPGTSGLYLFSGSDVARFYGQDFPEMSQKKAIDFERITSGLTRHLDVSPDGCKVVGKSDAHSRDRRGLELLLIDFCTKGN